jgi:hypothetical protein
MLGMDLGISKQVLKNKGSIRLVVRDVFLSQVFKGYSKYQNIDVSIEQRRDSRQLNLSFSYRFSKGKVGQQRKRSSVDETNRVSGGGN